LLKGEKMEHESRHYTIKDFLPLIIIFSLIMAITIIQQLYFGWNLRDAMRIFMAAFFIIFGFFKIINLHGFVNAYAMYDLIAQRYRWYGYLYPFLELGLGFAYLFKFFMPLTNMLTLILMLVSATGVFNELRKGKHIVCACLGDVFKLPMTYVTLTEDLLMALMALLMLIF
jgi:Methylamine utilisation protein MauE